LIRITRLSQDRWRDHRDLRLRALKAVSSAFGSSYEEEVKHPEEVWRSRIANVFFAVADGKPVGMMSLVFNDRIKTRHIAHIYGVYVDRSHRGKGIGRALLERTLSEAGKKRGIIKIQLSVNPALRPAVALYKSAGFEVVGRTRKELRIGNRFYDLLTMEKEI